MNIYIACDYKGVELKKELIKYLKEKKYNVLEIGMPNYDKDDYQKFAFKLGELVANDLNSKGILICSNGIGMSIAVNKVKGIRCVRATTPVDSYEGRTHNDCNVLAIGANLERDIIYDIVNTFIITEGPKLEELKIS